MSDRIDPSPALPYRGPVVVLDPGEVDLVRRAVAELARPDDPVATGLLAKCAVAQDADPRWREPLR